MDILKNQEVFTGDTAEKGSKLGAPVGRWGWRSRPAARVSLHVPRPCLSPHPSPPVPCRMQACPGSEVSKPEAAPGVLSGRGDWVRVWDGRLTVSSPEEGVLLHVIVSLRGSRRKWLH